MFRLYLGFAIVAVSGCSSVSVLDGVPASSTVYEEKQTLIAETRALAGQTLAENQPLKKYQVGGSLVYCSDVISGDLTLYRCFAFEGDKLTAGLNPQTFKLEPLESPVKLKFVGK